jgi:hypothetical protein
VVHRRTLGDATLMPFHWSADTPFEFPEDMIFVVIVGGDDIRKSFKDPADAFRYAEDLDTEDSVEIRPLTLS